MTSTQDSPFVLKVTMLPGTAACTTGFADVPAAFNVAVELTSVGAGAGIDTAAWADTGAMDGKDPVDIKPPEFAAMVELVAVTASPTGLGNTAGLALSDKVTPAMATGSDGGLMTGKKIKTSAPISKTRTESTAGRETWANIDGPGPSRGERKGVLMLELL
ncbi:hypothetical protein LP416_30805 [Polaromonas sp. P2-4]|nr:hypothetical protein LP416_30805 [Polaromonas sp. P2-4]